MQLFGVRQYFVGTGCSVQSVEFCGLELDAASGWIPVRRRRHRRRRRPRRRRRRCRRRCRRRRFLQSRRHRRRTLHHCCRSGECACSSHFGFWVAFLLC